MGKLRVIGAIIAIVGLYVLTTLIAPLAFEVRPAEPSFPSPGTKLSPLPASSPPPTIETSAPKTEKPALKPKPGSAALRVRVVDDRTGTGLDAHIELVPQSEPGGSRPLPVFVRCDREGFAEADAIPPNDRYLIRIWQPRYDDVDLPIQTLSANQALDLGVLRLAPQWFVRIKLNLPAPQFFSEFVVARPQFATRSKHGELRHMDNDGLTVVCGWLSRGKWTIFDGHYLSGEVRASIRQRLRWGSSDEDSEAATDYLPTYWSFDFEVTDSNLELDATVPAVATGGVVSGHVVNVAGKPLKHEPVRLVRVAPWPAPQDYFWIRTDEAGVFECSPLTDGSYVVYYGSGYQRRPNDEPSGAAVEVAAGKMVGPPLVLACPKRDFRILVTRRGVPQSGVSVEIGEGDVRQTPSLWRRQTGPGGFVDVRDFPLGDHWVELGGPGGVTTHFSLTKNHVPVYRFELLPPGTGGVSIEYHVGGQRAARQFDYHGWGESFYGAQGLWPSEKPLPNGRYDVVAIGSNFGPLLVPEVEVRDGVMSKKIVDVGRCYNVRFAPPTTQHNFRYYIQLTTKHGYQSRREVQPDKLGVVENVPRGKYRLIAVSNGTWDCWSAPVEIVDCDVDVKRWSEAVWQWPNTGNLQKEFWERLWAARDAKRPPNPNPLQITFEQPHDVQQTDISCATVQVERVDGTAHIFVCWPYVPETRYPPLPRLLYTVMVEGKAALQLSDIPADAKALVLRLPGYEDCRVVLTEGWETRATISVDPQRKRK